MFFTPVFGGLALFFLLISSHPLDNRDTICIAIEGCSGKNSSTQFSSSTSALLLFPNTTNVVSPPVSSGNCPSASPSTPIPGCWGEPGCAYVIAADLGPGAACSFDYCNCNGVAVPLLPTIISSRATVGCGAYSTVPTAKSCPTALPTGLSSDYVGNGSSSTPSSLAPNPSPPSLTAFVSPPGGSSTSPSASPSGSVSASPSASPSASLYASPSLSPSVSPSTSPSASQVSSQLSFPTSLSTTPPSSTPTATITDVLASNSGGGVGGTESLPNPVTTGGPISTASDAFDSAAPSITTISYNGGVLTYLKATFADLTSLKTPSTVSTTVTKTGLDKSVATYVGPIIVGAGGIFWGPPGDAPDCIWPFCSSSGPPSTAGGTTGGGIGGEGGGGFGCGTCSGGDDGGGDGGDDGGEGSDGEPASNACPGVGAKIRRSSFHYVEGHLEKREEEISTTTNALKEAFNLFGFDKSGKSRATNALDGAEEIICNRFPKGLQNAYITGLTGHYKLPEKLTVGTGKNQQNFRSGENLFWRVRWDYDLKKGPHVNAQFGTNPSSKFAFKVDKSQWTKNGDVEGNWPKQTMNKIIQDLNSKVGYSQADNMGKDEPKFPHGKDQAIQDLKNYFKSVAEGPCT